MTHRAIAWVSALGLGGCDPYDLEVRYVTQEAEIATAFEEPLCAGDLRFIDAHIAFLEHGLGTGEQEPIRVDLYEERPIPGCSDRAGGCYRDGRVQTEWGSVGHELVHAVANERGRPGDFWREGLAVAYGETFVARGEAGVAASVDLDTSELDYATAGHFTRWLIYQRGLGPYLQAYASGDFFRPERAVGTIPATYAESMATTEGAYLADAPWGYPRIHPCPHPELPFVDGTVEAAIHATCDDPQSTRFGGPLLGMVTAQRTIVVPQDGRYQLDVRSGWGVELVGCRLQPVRLDPGVRARGDVWDESRVENTALVWEAPGVYELELAAATYAVNLIGDPKTDGTLVEFSLRQLF